MTHNIQKIRNFVLRILTYSIGLILIVSCLESKQVTRIGRVLILNDTISAAYDTIQMGRMNEGEIISGNFAIRNETSKPIVINNVVTGCGCTTTKYDTKPIKIEEERTIDFTFDSRGRQGWQIKTIDIILSDNRIARLVLEGEITSRRD